MGREEQLLAASIADAFSDAWDAERQFVDAVETSTAKQLEESEGVLEEYSDVLDFYVEMAFRDIGLLAERLQAPQFAALVREQFLNFKAQGLSSTHYSSIESEQRCTALEKAHHLYKSLSVMTDGSAVTGLDTFKTILKNTGAIVHAKGIRPSKEAEVRRAIFEVLQFAFPDAVRDPPIGKLLKNYRPDVGVRSLMAAAEYKFVRTEPDLKNSLDGVLSDMKGYGRDPHWRTFFAVIYTTQPVTNIDRIEAAFRSVNADNNWTPILIAGHGAPRVPPTRKTIRPVA